MSETQQLNNSTTQQLNNSTTQQLTDFISFWENDKFYEDTKILKADYECLKNSDSLISEKYNSKNPSNFITAFLNDKNNDYEYKFHPYLMPEPYSGNLKEAKVYVLNLNPGFLFADYNDIQNSEYKNALENNLSQDFNETEFPLTFLNPQFAWTDASRYWLKKFDASENSFIKRLQDEKICSSYTDGMKYLSNRIALLELVPYHSKHFKYSNLSLMLKQDKKSPTSVQKMIDFINGYVISKATTEEALLVVTRQVKLLKEAIPKLEKGKDIILFKSNESRSASLSANSEYREKIWKFLTKK